MEAADEGWDDVAVFGMVVVSGAVQVRWHDTAKVCAVLTVVAFAEFDTGDLGYSVWFIGRLKRPGQQCIFGHWLRSHLGIDATRTEKE